MFDYVWNFLLSIWNFAIYRIKMFISPTKSASEIGDSLHISDSITRHEHAIRIVSILNTNDFYSL